MRTCKTCRFWKPAWHSNDLENDPHAGECSCPKFVYQYEFGLAETAITPEDGLSYWDGEGYSASFRVGPEFGCIHHQPKPEN